MQKWVVFAALGVWACGSSDEGTGPDGTATGGNGGAGAMAGAPGTGGLQGTGAMPGTGGTQAGGSGGTGAQSGAGGAPPGGSGGSGGNGAGGMTPLSDGGPPDAETPHRFFIEFDYSEDSAGWFDVAEKRQGLEAAAALWADRILDDFEEIPAGTAIRLRNLEQVDDTYIDLTLEQPIDDLRIYVACSEVLDTEGVSGRTRRSALFPGDQGVEFQQRLVDRWSGEDQEPWAVGIAFGCEENFFFDPTPETDNDIPDGAVDFITVAAHEIGHALGIGASQTYIDNQNADRTAFLGAEAQAIVGGPVPNDADQGHLSSDLLVAGQPILLDRSQTVGRRTYPTALEFAILADIGYEIAE